MKLMLKFFALTALLILSSVQLEAQRGGRDMNPEARAEAQTKQMTEDLALSEAQTAKVSEVNLKYAQKMTKAREDADGDWSSMREVMTKMREEQMTELKTYLSEEQFATYEKLQAERRSKGQRGGDRPNPENRKGKKPSDKKSNGVG